MLDFYSAIKNRRSVRNYIDKKITHDNMSVILDSARLATTARNIQPCQFIVIDQKELLMKLGQICTNGSFIKDASVCIITVSKDTKYYLEDGCAATENILIAATGLGIGSCWIAGDKKGYCTEIKGLFKVPDNYKLVSLISLGYYEGDIVSPTKKKLENIVHHNEYKKME